ncbi:hypothetical protein ACSSS7_003418 [Eimeria intestinalis]
MLQSLPLAELLSDAALERHKQSLLLHLQGADGNSSNSSNSSNSNSSNNNSKSSSNGSGESGYYRLRRLGRSTIEWLGPSRLVFADEIWRRRYDFSSLKKLMQACRHLTPAGVRSFYSNEILAAPWLLLEVDAYVPPWTPRSPEFLLYNQTHAAAPRQRGRPQQGNEGGGAHMGKRGARHRDFVSIPPYPFQHLPGLQGLGSPLRIRFGGFTDPGFGWHLNQPLLWLREQQKQQQQLLLLLQQGRADPSLRNGA